MISIIKKLLILLIVIVTSCYQSEEKNNNKRINISNTDTTLIEKKIPKNFESDRIIFAEFQNGELNSYNFSKLDKMFEITRNSVIINFQNLLSKKNYIGYCCCPGHTFTLSFYYKNKLSKSYFIDTAGYKDNVVVFPIYGFSECYKIEKKEIKTLIDSSKKLSYNRYSLCNLKIARKLNNYAEKLELPVINNLKFDYPWNEFDGKFYIPTYKEGLKISKEDIDTSIQKAYPNDNYSIGFEEEINNSDLQPSNNNIQEFVIPIYCNKEFYNKFNIFSQKSSFQSLCVDIAIIGNRSNLNELDKIAKKEKE